jgi:hypothetical protein
LVSLYFVQKLIKKLKTGNNRSIHLNASTASYARLDWYDWSLIDPSLHIKFLHLMMTKQSFSFYLKIIPTELEKKSEQDQITLRKLIARLDAITYQSRDEYSEYGTKTFGLGYPMLIRKDAIDSSKQNMAPILIWYFDIEKDNHSPLTWRISRNEEHPVVFNDLLGNLIQSQDKFILEDVYASLENEPFSEQLLSNFCQKFLSLLQADATQIDKEVKIIPCPDKHSLIKLLEVAPCIRWSGVWGLYRHTKESIISDLEYLTVNSNLLIGSKDSAEVGKIENQGILSPIDTDPSQEKILIDFYRNENQKVVVNGPPGTGKSQTISALISQELLQGRTCLVICEKKTAQEVIYINLEKIGLSSLCLLADDWIKSRNEAVKAVRFCTDNMEDYVADYKNKTFDLDYNEYNTLKERLNSSLATLNSKVWGDDTLSEIISRLSVLEKKYINFSDLINNSYFNKFQFNIESYLNLNNKVKEAVEKFKPYGQTNDLFEYLESPLFKNHTEAYLQEAFSEEVNEVFELVEKLESCFEKGVEISESQFNDSGKFGFVLKRGLGLFVPKYKSLVQLRKEYFKLLNDVLSHASFLSKLDIETDNKFDLYNAPIHHAYVLKIKSTLGPMVREANLWSKYVPWRIFLEQLPSGEKAIFKCISKSEIDDWEEALQFVFYHQIFHQNLSALHHQKDFDETRNNIENLETKLRPILVDKINHDWQERRLKLVRKKTIKATKLLYNFRKNQQYGSKNSLRKIIHNDVAFFTDFFPVLITNPTVGSSILPMDLGLYDTVIFDESSQLRLEDTFSGALRGKKVLISGDKHQMPPSSYFESTVFFPENNEEESLTNEISDDFLAESDSLLEYAYDTDFKNYYLDFHYRSKHPHLIQFSNACFYGSRLIPMPAKKDYPPFEYFKVDGVYSKGGINESEAIAVVDYLERISGNADFFDISVGVATFNIHQRNLILDTLGKRCNENVIFAQILNHWLSLGFFVKNLENIQGEERDLMLISTTFGANEEGKFSQHFGPILRAHGYKLLNVLFTRAKSKMAIFTSIPVSNISSYALEIKEKGITGKSILYAYLHYVNLLSSGRIQEGEQLIKFLQMNSKDHFYEPSKIHLTPFKQLIYKYLLDFNKVEVKVHESWGGIVPDFILYKNGVVSGFVECCDSKFYSTETGYRHLLFRSKIYAGYKVPVFFVMPQSWYQSDGEKELNQFIELI